jgi:FKBP-type peptidyl-prolyl cis-trans isomerase
VPDATEQARSSAAPAQEALREASEQGNAKNVAAPGIDKARACYAIGGQFGTQLKNAGLADKTVSMPDLEKGLRAALGGTELKREDLEPVQAYITALRQVAADVNHKKAAAFLAANGTKPGVVTTTSGLQYKVLQLGSGDPPKRTDTVSVNYTGKLLDGTEFDGTDRHGGQPVSFPVANLIPGFTEALMLMNPGAKFQVFIPPDLAYDVQVPPGSAIPPGAALIFDIELVNVLSGTTPESEAPTPKTETKPAATDAATDALSPAARAKASYSIGLQFGTQMKNAGLEEKTVSMPDLEEGLRAALGGKEFKRGDLEPVQAYLTALRQAAANVNHKKAEAFLAANAKKPGVITTQSGLQYKVLQPGMGDPPKGTDRVSIYFTGTLLDGTEFDGTDKRGGQPAELPVGGNIPGFTEALLLMQPGAKFQIFIPPDLGYGPNVRPGSPIPPNAALIFDVEMLKILPPTPVLPAPQPSIPGYPAVPPPAH